MPQIDVSLVLHDQDEKGNSGKFAHVHDGKYLYADVSNPDSPKFFWVSLSGLVQKAEYVALRSGWRVASESDEIALKKHWNLYVSV